MNALFGPEAKLFRALLDHALRSSNAASASRRMPVRPESPACPPPNSNRRFLSNFVVCYALRN